MSDIVDEIELTGFDPEGEPSIVLMMDGSLRVEFNFMPPSWAPEVQDDMGAFENFDKQLSDAAGVEVIWEDREVFVIYEYDPQSDTIERVQKFIENYPHD
ncbi:MAG: hypothetical protein WCT04_03015 [Planctomycetota bacterium]